jgi:hypothetical protein
VRAPTRTCAAPRFVEEPEPESNLAATATGCAALTRRKISAVARRSRSSSRAANELAFVSVFSRFRENSSSVLVVVVALEHRPRHALAAAEQDVRQAFQEVLRGDELAVVTQQHVERGDELRLCFLFSRGEAREAEWTRSVGSFWLVG